MYSCDPATGRPGFTATLLQGKGGTPIVSVFGEVDLCNADDLDILMLKAIAESGKSAYMIVDLGGVEFMDLTGLRILISARSVLENSPGGSLAVVGSEPVMRLLEVTGITEDFELYPDLVSAVAGYPVSA
ncbi:MAG: STAS domain-containing protein [Rubrobacter sp.]|nr:STAS domain-containing protein [Rubrobacter sp.]